MRHKGSNASSDLCRLVAEKGRDGTVGYELDELDNLAALTLPHEQRIDYLSYGSGHVHQVPWQHEAIDPFRNTGETLLRVIKDVRAW